MRVRATARLAGAMAAVTVVAGCGSSSSANDPKTTTIDPTRVEKAIEVSVAEQSHRMSIVVCPTGIRREKGKRFNCIATLARGDKYPFRVTQKDDRGNVHYEQAAGATKGTTTTP
ncbi:MAG: hypothetical protein QOE11_3398 [Solirubrobacteraceae bacterium]|jgi:hypothetical protein|nr:hypothetical protein [Solirubrobacteraceae bacterium]